MKLLGNRGVAVVISVVVMAAAALFAIYSSTNSAAREAEAMFVDGVYLREQGFTQPGISSHLDNISNAALSLSSIMRNYSETASEAAQLSEQREVLLSAQSLGAKAAAVSSMRSAMLRLLDAADGANLPERDMEALAQLSRTFTGAIIAIEESRYNEAIQEHMHRQSALLRPIARLLGAHWPEPFVLS